MVEMTGSIADFYQFHLQNLIKEPPNEWMCDTPSCNCIILYRVPQNSWNLNILKSICSVYQL